MSIAKFNLHKINEIIHHNLEMNLKKLSPRMHFKYFCIFHEKDGSIGSIIRVKKTVSVDRDHRFRYLHDTLKTIEQVLDELSLPHEVGNHISNFNNYIHQMYSEIDAEDLSNTEYAAVKSKSKTDADRLVPEPDELTTILPQVGQMIYYGRTFSVQVGKEVASITCLIGIRNVEPDAMRLYYEKPEISYLRMVLDYYFTDFYSPGVRGASLFLNEANQLDRKYNEDTTHFLRRITRLFFGKVQLMLQNESNSLWGEQVENDIRNEYYVNTLMEKIDEISTKTYESASPFGSILLLNERMLDQNSNIIKFAVKFSKDDRIDLEDAKRIRKLLELTSEEKHLYLVGDHKSIYGLGEVRWSELHETLCFRVDFRGLSKYNLIITEVKVRESKEGRLIKEDDGKVYRTDRDHVIRDHQLVSVAFKNPRLAEEGYSSDRIVKVLYSQFWQGDEGNEEAKRNAVKLEGIIRKAREQKYGTMVVISDPYTTQEEIIKLKRQSTLIEPMAVNSDYIKYLTSIDGAIYFDTTGECYAIGVILDGIAQEDQGDASRGARYNSAHRYLAKLNNHGKKCVIVIISEDGTVDIIPETENEEKVFTLMQEMIDILGEEHEHIEALFTSKEEELSRYAQADYDLLYGMGLALYNKKMYDKATNYFMQSYEIGGKDWPSEWYSNCGFCHEKMGTEENFLISYRMHEKALEIEGKPQFNHYFNIGNIAYKVGEMYVKAEKRNDSFDYLLKALTVFKQTINFAEDKSIEAALFNRIGLTYDLLRRAKWKKDINQIVEEEIEMYAKAIALNKLHSYYWNRALSYGILNMPTEAANDLIEAHLLKPEKRYLDKIESYFIKHPEIVPFTADYYAEQRKMKHSDKAIEELLNRVESAHNSVESGKVESAAASSSE